jgi:hypothetical protein
MIHLVTLAEKWAVLAEMVKAPAVVEIANTAPVAQCKSSITADPLAGSWIEKTGTVVSTGRVRASWTWTYPAVLVVLVTTARWIFPFPVNNTRLVAAASE